MTNDEECRSLFIVPGSVCINYKHIYNTLYLKHCEFENKITLDKLRVFTNKLSRYLPIVSRVFIIDQRTYKARKYLDCIQIK